MQDALGTPQTVLVLGGGSEIGLATARLLAGRGTRTIVLAARAPERLEDAAAQLRAAGAATVELVPFDADEPASHAGLVEAVAERHGDLDVVLVAFGVLGTGAEDAGDAEPALAVLRTNLLGAASVMSAAAARLRGQGHGALVLLSSVAGERGRSSNYVYGASKAGIDAFAQGLGDRLHGSGARVLVVRPGFVRTKMTAGLDPAPLSTSPEKVAEAIVGGLSRRAETVWVPGPLRFVMSGLRHLPRPLFRRLDL